MLRSRQHTYTRGVPGCLRTLGIPHHVVDLSHEYRHHILENFNSEYLAGRTPNPCVLCNRYIKFGALFDAVERMGIEFDRFATGHYVRRAPYGDRLTLEVAAGRTEGPELLSLPPEAGPASSDPLPSGRKDEGGEQKAGG